MFCRVGAGGPGCEAVMFRCCSGTHPLRQRRPCWVFRWQTDLALNAVSAPLTGGFTLLRCPCWHGGDVRPTVRAGGGGQAWHPGGTWGALDSPDTLLAYEALI